MNERMSILELKFHVSQYLVVVFFYNMFHRHLVSILLFFADYNNSFYYYLILFLTITTTKIWPCAICGSVCEHFNLKYDFHMAKFIAAFLGGNAAIRN